MNEDPTGQECSIWDDHKKPTDDKSSLASQAEVFKNDLSKQQKLDFNKKKYREIIKIFDECSSYESEFNDEANDRKDLKKEAKDVITEYESVAANVHLQFVNKCDDLKLYYENEIRKLKDSIASIQAETESYEKSKSESEETIEELNKLLAEGDKESYIDSSVVRCAYTDMVNHIKDSFSAPIDDETNQQNNDVENMTQILLQEIIFRAKIPGLDALTELFVSSGHKNWILHVRKQAVSAAIKEQSFETTKNTAVDDANTLLLIISAFKRKYSHEPVLESRDELLKAASKAAQLSKYAIAYKHYFNDDLIPSGLKNLQPHEDVPLDASMDIEPVKIYMQSIVLSRESSQLAEKDEPDFQQSMDSLSFLYLEPNDENKTSCISPEMSRTSSKANVPHSNNSTGTYTPPSLQHTLPDEFNEQQHAKQTPSSGQSSQNQSPASSSKATIDRHGKSSTNTLKPGNLQRQRKDYSKAVIPEQKKQNFDHKNDAGELLKHDVRISKNTAGAAKYINNKHVSTRGVSEQGNNMSKGK